MKKIIYADTNSYDVFHKGFNSSSLLMFSKIYDLVIYFATPSAANIIKQDFGGSWPKNVVYRKIWINEPKNKLGKILHHLLQLFFSITIVLFYGKKRTVYFNYTPLLSLPLLNIISKLLNIKILLTCHSELDFLINNNFQKLNKFSIKALKLLKSKNHKCANSLYFCCLGSHIKRNAKNVLSDSTWSKLISFEHTWIFDQSIIGKTFNEEKIQIGFVGTICEEKWLDSILYLRNNLSHNKFELSTVGRIFCNPDLLNAHNIKYVEGADKGFLSSERFKSEVSKLDFIIFLYPKESFKMTASGSIFDAINAEKHVLALHNDCFDSLFQRTKFGTLFQNESEIISFLKNDEYVNNKRIDHKMVKEDLSPFNEASKLKDELERIFFI
jgi:hypothetical protein